MIIAAAASASAVSKPAQKSAQSQMRNDSSDESFAKYHKT